MMPNLPSGSQRPATRSGRHAEHRPGALDLIAYLSVLAVAGLLLALGLQTGSSPSRLYYCVGALVVTCFGVWLRLHHPARRRWNNGAISYTSRTGRLRVSRAWGTENGPEPLLPQTPARMGEEPELGNEV